MVRYAETSTNVDGTRCIANGGSGGTGGSAGTGGTAGAGAAGGTGSAGEAGVVIITREAP